MVGQKNIQIAPPATWLASLRLSGEVRDGTRTDVFVAQNPALKLAGFFDTLWSAGAGLVSGQPMVVERAMAASPALRKLEHIGIGSMRKWVKEWLAA